MSTLDSRGTSTPLPAIDLVLATALGLLDGFLAHKILRPYLVAVANGSLPIHVLDRRVYTAKRAPDGSFQRIISEVGADKYACSENGLELPLYDGDVRVYGDRARAETHKAKQVALSLLLARESAAAALLMSTTTFAAGRRVDVTGGKYWSAATGVPLDDLTNAIALVSDSAGVPAERLTLTIAAEAYRALSRNTQVINQVKATPAFANLGSSSIPAVIPASVMAAVLGIKEVLIATNLKDSANRAKTSSLAAVWDKTKCLVSYNGMDVGEDVALGHTFTTDEGMDRSALSAAADLPADPALVFRADMYRDEKITADIIRVRDCTDTKVTNVNAGALITGILA